MRLSLNLLCLYTTSPSAANDVKNRTRLADEVSSNVLGDKWPFAGVLAGVTGFDGPAGLAGFTIVFGEVTLTLVVTDIVFPSARL